MKKLLISVIFMMTSTLLMADGASIFKKCAACHGAKAEKSALGKSKIIAGWPAEKVMFALKGFKDGSYGGSMKMIMKGQASSLSKEDITLVAKYISTLK